MKTPKYACFLWINNDITGGKKSFILLAKKKLAKFLLLYPIPYIILKKADKICWKMRKIHIN